MTISSKETNKKLSEEMENTIASLISDAVESEKVEGRIEGKFKRAVAAQLDLFLPKVKSLEEEAADTKKQLAEKLHCSGCKAQISPQESSLRAGGPVLCNSCDDIIHQPVILNYLEARDFWRKQFREEAADTKKKQLAEKLENIHWNLQEAKKHIESEIHAEGLCDIDDGECELPKTIDILIERTSKIIAALESSKEESRCEV